MQMLTIGEVADRSGFTTSTLRYYERHDLLRPSGRTAAGYRVYDDAVLDRLRFIRRAKDLGCSLDDIRELTRLVEGEECGLVQQRLHELVTARIADAERRREEVVEFISQLRVAAALLGGQPAEGSCRDDCACMAPPVTDEEPVAIACGLSSADVPSRVREWRELLAHVDSREWASSGALRLTLSDGVAVEHLASLVQAEQACCSFFAFALTMDGRGLGLEVSAPPEGKSVLASLFGEPQ